MLIETGTSAARVHGNPGHLLADDTCGQADGTISRDLGTEATAAALLGTLLALRLQARVGASRAQLQALAVGQLALLTNRKDR